MPLPSAPPEWLTAARAACFGSAESGLPGPVRLDAARPGAGELPRRDPRPLGLGAPRPRVRSVARSPLGACVFALIAAAMIAEGVWVSAKVRAGVAVAAWDPGAPGRRRHLPATYPRQTAVAPDFTPRRSGRGDESRSAASGAGRCVLTFVFAHCQTMCPLLVQNIKQAAPGAPPSEVLAGHARSVAGHAERAARHRAAMGRPEELSRPVVGERGRGPERRRRLSGALRAEREDRRHHASRPGVPRRRRGSAGLHLQQSPAGLDPRGARSARPRRVHMPVDTYRRLRLLAAGRHARARAARRGPSIGVFDRIYSSTYNPLYRTGTLASLCLTVALVTGVYLLFVYEIARPYESMAGIQSDVFLGRWIRALHRYVSDAAVVAVLVHVAAPAGAGQDVGAAGAGLDHGRPARRDDVRVRRDRVRAGLGRVRPEAGRRGRQDAPAASALPRAARPGVRRRQARRRAVLLHEPLPPRGRPAGDDRLSVAAHRRGSPGRRGSRSAGSCGGPSSGSSLLSIALARAAAAGGRSAGHSRPREHGLVLRLLASPGARLPGRRARDHRRSSAACFCSSPWLAEARDRRAAARRLRRPGSLRGMPAVLSGLSVRRDPDGARQASREASAPRRRPAGPLRELRSLRGLVRVAGHRPRGPDGRASARLRAAARGEHGRTRRQRTLRRELPEQRRRPGEAAGAVRRERSAHLRGGLRGHAPSGHRLLPRGPLRRHRDPRMPAAELRPPGGRRARRPAHPGRARSGRPGPDRAVCPSGCSTTRRASGRRSPPPSTASPSARQRGPRWA